MTGAMIGTTIGALEGPLEVDALAPSLDCTPAADCSDAFPESVSGESNAPVDITQASDGRHEGSPVSAGGVRVCTY